MSTQENQNEIIDLELLEKEDPESMYSLQHLINWYSEYAKEVVMDRAIINLDGLKPVQRRILYAMYKEGYKKELKPNARVVGSVITYHPHGDGSIYSSLTRMVDLANYANFPMLKGKGDLGSVYSKGKPAHMRYTYSTLNDASEVAFKGMSGIKMLTTESGEDTEPELLPIAVPLGLMNASSGIAVGMASNIPSFNVNEVVNAAIEYIETGDLKTLLVPDFSTGSDIVISKEVLTRIRDKGKGSFKLRAKWKIDGKRILISEVPYYTTHEEILKQIEKGINEGEITGISSYKDITDLNKIGLEVTCTNKNMVESVLTQLLRKTSIQITVPTNMMVIVRNIPKLLSVKEYIKEWMSFREEVVERILQNNLDAVLAEIPKFEILVDLLGTDAKREEFMVVLSKQGTKEARQVLRKFYPNEDDDVFSWIMAHRLTSLGGVGNKGKKLAELYQERDSLQDDLANIPRYIIRELREFNSNHHFPRKTTSSEVDYVFEKEADVKVELPAVQSIVQLDGKFFKRYNVDVLTRNLPGIHCSSKDVISMIDTQGRLLRVKVEDVPPISGNGRGVYLPTYLGLADDFDIVVSDVISDKKVGYLYSDGFVSVLDYSEWSDSKRTTKVTSNGVSPESGKIINEFPIGTGYLYILTNKGRFAFASANFKHKHRTARTKLINLKPDEFISFSMPVSSFDMLKLVSNSARYIDKLGILDSEDVFDMDYFKALSEK